jgi:hypothetical protein
MDALTITPTTWRGMEAWTIAGPALNVVLTRIGCHLAAIRRQGEQLNPLWQPQWPAADPATVAPGGSYGGIEASLLATIVGHNLCLDRFGPPYPGETRPVHGEAGTARWTLAQPSPGLVELTAELPEARLTARTRVAITGETLLLTHGVRHDGPGVRELEWCEHANVGDPFLAGARVSAGIDRVYNWAEVPEPGSRFAALAPMAEVPVADALAVPGPDAPPCGDVLAAHVAEGWWMIENPALRRRLTYRWDPAHFPWLTLWTQHRSRSGAPWNGRERTRGMELTTKPFPDGLRPHDRHPSFKGTPTVCRVAPGGWREHPLRIEWTATA